MEITELKFEDWNQYIDLLYQLGGYKESINMSDFKKKYKSIKEQNSFIYVIKVNDKLIATGKLFVELKIFDSLGHIEDIIVDSEYRKFGYGKIIIQYLLNESKKMGCYKCVLDAKDELIQFYSKCGMDYVGANFVKRFK